MREYFDFFLQLLVLVRGGAVVLGTALKAGKSWVRFPTGSLKFLIDLPLSTALWSWGQLVL
jgi:hypothetical protein